MQWRTTAQEDSKKIRNLQSRAGTILVPALLFIPFATSSTATGYGGVASLTVTITVPGENSVVANYSGNSSIGGSTSPVLIQTVFGGGTL